MAGMTKDEKFLLQLYRAAKDAGDFDRLFDKYAIGREIGLQERGVDTICKLLAQANFIKRAGEEIRITDHGCNLARTLLGEKK